MALPNIKTESGLKIIDNAPQPQIQPPVEPVAAAGLAGGKYKPDDDEIAVEISDYWQTNYRYFHSEWKRWTGSWWENQTSSEVHQEIREMIREMRARGVRVTRQRIKSIADLLELDLYVKDRAVMERETERQQYVNLNNGMYNLKTGELESHDPDLYFTHCLDFDYDPDADCPNFRKYLNSSLVDEHGNTDFQLVMLVKQALAYSMTARTDLKASFWLVGKPDSGKSTFIAFLRLFMGSLHSTIDLNQLATNKYLLSGIAGKRVVTFTEASSNNILPEGLYKAMVGGSDEIYADVKHKDAISFKPVAKFWWAMNEMPRIVDRSAATFNRLHIIPFNRSIPKSKRIMNLEQVLYQERSGIFNEVLIAYQRLVNGGRFEKCDQSERIRQQYQLENDTEMIFVQETFVKKAGATIQSQYLYDLYSSWCERTGFHPKNITQVAKEWRRLGFEDYRSGGQTLWRGYEYAKNSK